MLLVFLDHAYIPGRGASMDRLLKTVVEGSVLQVFEDPFDEPEEGVDFGHGGNIVCDVASWQGAV